MEGPDPNPSQHWELPRSPTGSTGSRAACQGGMRPRYRAEIEEPAVTRHVGDFGATIPAAGAQH